MGNAELTQDRLDLIRKMLRVDDLMGKGSFQFFIDLFLHNFLASAVSTLSGFVPFLFLPIFTTIFNAYIFGLVLAATELAGKSVFLSILTMIAPHGIFEIPAFLYAASLGVYITVEIFRYFFRRESRPRTDFNEVLEHLLCSYMLIIIPLLLVAAFIEAYITPLLAKLIV